jgi:hypothetical protein
MYNDNVKDAATIFLSGIFYSAYIFKQSLLTDTAEVTTFVAILAAFALIAINYEYLFAAAYEFKRILLQLVLSIILVGILFHQPIMIMAVILKVVFIIILTALDSRNNKRIMLVMADFGVLCLIIIGVGVALSFIPSQYITSTQWSKNNFGFVNPNVVSYFFFASLFVYFIQGKSTRFWLLLIVIFVLWQWFDVYSRTFIIGSILLSIYALVAHHEIISTALVKWVTKFVLLLSLIYLSICALMIFNVKDMWMEWTLALDGILSARLLFISFNDFYVSNSGPLLYIKPFDSIYYELLFVLGPYALYKWIQLFRTNFFNSQSDRDMRMHAYALSVFALAGLFEGIFIKMSPILLIVVMIMSSGFEGKLNRKISN